MNQKPKSAVQLSAAATGDPLQQALQLHQRGETAKAEEICREIVARTPQDFRALYLLSLIASAQRRLEEAESLVARALAIKNNDVSALNHRGSVLYAMGRLKDALQSFDKAIALNPNNAELLTNRGNVLMDMRLPEEALASFDQSLAIEPYSALTLYNRGNALQTLGRAEDALTSYDTAVALIPNFAEALVNRGGILRQLGRIDEAILSFDKALAVRPGFVEALNAKGVTQAKIERFEDALVTFDQVLAARPDYPEAINNRASVLQQLNRYDDAADAFARLREVKPDYDSVLGNLFSSRMRCCDWRAYDTLTREIDSAVDAGVGVITPWMYLIHSNSARRQLKCSELYARKHKYARLERIGRGERYAHDKIRIAYLSADFHTHATAYLMASLFEKHDRSRFVTHAISFGRDDKTPMRARLEAAFDTFIDVRSQTDRQVAALLREREIDIAIDLKGYTNEARTDILAHRSAPIQINYLGFPGTMAVDFIDYIIADRRLIPEDHEPFYSEKVICLPDSYQINDNTRRISDRPMARTHLGLPPQGFVFCSFNSNYKITPAIFDIWMRLLQEVDGSVLWLIESNAAAGDNLRSEAQRRGVAPERLVFAPPVILEEHLARHRFADLFLDTLPCNAHTTASDALWAGLPIVTCLGGAFAGRVAASLLYAVGLPDLITDSLDAYYALALQLATTPAALAEVKARLARNRDTCPLFDTTRLCRQLESAYATIWQRHQRGEAPTRLVMD